MHERLGYVVRRVSERRLDGIRVGDEGPLVGHVCPTVLVDHDPVGLGVLDGDDGVERFVVDDDALEAVCCGVAGFGDHDGDDVARIVGLSLRHRVVGRVLHVVGYRPGTGQGGRPGVGQIVTGVDGDHAVDA